MILFVLCWRNAFYHKAKALHRTLLAICVTLFTKYSVAKYASPSIIYMPNRTPHLRLFISCTRRSIFSISGFPLPRGGSGGGIGGIGGVSLCRGGALGTGIGDSSASAMLLLHSEGNISCRKDRYIRTPLRPYSSRIKRPSAMAASLVLLSGNMV